MKLGQLEQGCVFKFAPEGLDWVVTSSGKGNSWPDWIMIESENGTRRVLSGPRLSQEVILIVVGLQVDPTDASGQWKVALANILQE